MKKNNNMPLYFSFIIFKQKWRYNYTTDIVARETSVTDNKTFSAGSIRIGQGLTKKWKN